MVAAPRPPLTSTAALCSRTSDRRVQIRRREPSRHAVAHDASSPPYNVRAPTRCHVLEEESPVALRAPRDVIAARESTPPLLRHSAVARVRVQRTPAPSAAFAISAPASRRVLRRPRGLQTHSVDNRHGCARKRRNAHSRVPHRRGRGTCRRGADAPQRTRRGRPSVRAVAGEPTRARAPRTVATTAARRAPLPAAALRFSCAFRGRTWTCADRRPCARVLRGPPGESGFRFPWPRAGCSRRFAERASRPLPGAVYKHVLWRRAPLLEGSAEARDAFRRNSP